MNIVINGIPIEADLDTAGVLNLRVTIIPSHIEGLEAGVYGIIERFRKEEKGEHIPDSDGTPEDDARVCNALLTFLRQRYYIESAPGE
jgi:hypothetical protein